MAFDPTTAKPLDGQGGSFDPSTAKPFTAPSSDKQKLTLPNLGDKGNLVGDIQSKLNQDIRDARGMASDIDYDTGASPIAKYWLTRSDNPAEAKKALENFYGSGNFGQDASGRYWVKENGKKVEVFGGGQGLTTALKKMGYDMYAYMPQLAGAALGATGATSMAPEGGPVSAIAGAGFGAAGGSALAELGKRLTRLYAKTPAEEVAKIGNDAIFNAAFEGLGPTAKAVLSPIKNGIKSFLGITERGAAMTKSLVRQGAKVPVQTGAPGAKVLAYHSDVRTRIMGDPKEAHNVAFIRSQLVDLLHRSGYTEDQTDSIMHEVANKDASIGQSETGRAVTEKVSDYHAALQKEADSAVDTARAAVKEELGELDKIASVDPSGLGKDSARTIVLARKKFGAAMSRAYNSVDAMTGGRKLISGSDIKDATREALGNLPETNQPANVRAILGRNTPYSFLEAHNLRSDLRAAADTANLTRDPLAHAYGEIADAIDRAMNQAGKDLESRGETNAAKALRGVDKQYADGIGKFKDATFRQIAKRAQTGIFPEPEKIAEQLINPKEIGRLDEFLKMAPPTVRAKVAAVDMKNLLVSAKDDSGVFLSEVTKRGKALDSLYGPEIAGKLRKSAKELAALDGKLPKDIPMEPGQVADALQKQITYTKMLDTFVEKNPVASLGNPKLADRAVSLITAPGKESATLATQDFFGASSPEWKAVQTEALKKLLSRAIAITPSLDAKVIGDAMKNELGKFTKKQIEALFPNGLDKDLRVLADKANFLFPNTPEEMGGTFHAAAVKGTFPLSAPVYLWDKFWGWVADHPQWLYRMAGVADKQDPSEFKLMRGALYKVAAKSTLAPQGPNQ